MNGRRLALLSGGAPRHPRPAPRTQALLTPFDPSDNDGRVYTELPPGFSWQKLKYGLYGDFGAITLEGTWKWTGYDPTSGGQPALGAYATILDGQFAGLVIPWVIGANSTPPTRFMLPMMPLYPTKVQDAVFTAACQRDYRDFTIADRPWNDEENGYASTPAKAVAWARIVKSWGFRVPLWSTTPINGDPTFRAMLNAHCIDFYVPGEEIATSGDHRIIAEDLPPLLDTAYNDCGDGLQIAIHLGPNAPLRAPGDTFLDGGPNRGSWAQYNNRRFPLGLAWEGGNLTENPLGFDSAGAMSALIGYARRMVQLGKSGDGDWGIPGPDCPIYGWELLANGQLEGTFDETDGARRGWEILCAPPDPGCAFLDGINNGLWQPDGTSMRRLP